jgi:hypothetical protein
MCDGVDERPLPLVRVLFRYLWCLGIGAVEERVKEPLLLVTARIGKGVKRESGQADV